MNVVVPNLGNLSAVLCAFLREIGGSFVGPTPNSERTAILGTKYAPNDACMPMKLVLGSFLEGAEMGADTALFFGGCGPCCFGYFAQTFQLIFDRNGVPMRVIALEKNWKGVRDAMTFLSSCGEKSAFSAVSRIRSGMQCAQALDDFEQAVYRKRAEIRNEREKQRLIAFAADLQTQFHAAQTLTELRQTAARGIRELAHFKSDCVPSIKIGIVGDIYTVIDPFMNKHIQTLLADMGAYSERSMSLSGWIDNRVKRNPQTWTSAADAFLPEKVGGFARETVGCAALWAKQDFDGIIELYPLNCMPESVARTILPKVSATYQKPIMSLIVDEMRGDAGYLTRLEAFTQMIIRKKAVHFEQAVPGN